MATDSTTAAGLFKRLYDDREIEKIVNEAVVTWKKIPKSPKRPAGEGYFFPVNVQGNQRGTGSINELEALHTPDTQVVQQGKVIPKIIEHTIRMSGLSMELAKGNEDSFADNVTYQMEEGLNDTAKECNAQLFRQGLGRLATVNGAVSSSATVTFKSGVPTHFRRGMYIDTINAGGTKQISGIKITDISIPNLTITLASTQSCDDNSYIYREHVGDNAPYDGKEVTGLKMVVDDGGLASTYENISRTTYPQFNGINIDKGSANLSNDSLQQAISRVKIFSNGKMPNKVISNTAQMRKYLDVVTPLKRFQDKSKMDSGYEEVPTWNGMEWIEDTDCDFDRVYLVNTKYLEKFELYPLKFDERGGDVMKWDPDYDAYVAYAKTYVNIGTRVPNAHAALINLATPTF